jgi:hypothetical protein
MRTALFIVTFLALGPVQANAEEKEAAIPPVTPQTVGQPELVSTPLSSQELQGISGGDAVIVEAYTEQTLNATVSNSTITAESVETGTVNFAPNSLNFHGIGNFVMNTGNNNVLQGSLSVTILSGPASP